MPHPMTPEQIAAELSEQVKLGNQRGLYDTSKMGPELVAYLDDRAGMLEGLRDEMSEGYRGWLDDAVEALRTAAKRCAEVASQPVPASSDLVERELESALCAPNWPTCLGHVHNVLAVLKAGE